MPPDVGSLMVTASVWLLTYLLHSTALIAAAWVVTRVVRLDPSTRDFVWRLAILAGVVTATGVHITPDVGERVVSGEDFRIVAVERVGDAVGPDVDRAELHRTDVDRMVVDRLSVDRVAFDRTEVEDVRMVSRRAVRLEDGSGLDMPARLRPDRASPFSDECRAALAGSNEGDAGWLTDVEELCATSAGVTWRTPLVALWFVGALLGLVALAAGYRAARSLGGRLFPPDGRTVALARTLGSRATSVRVAISPELASPCVLSGSAIGLPERCEQEMDDAELTAVLAHELAHVVRRDALWTALMRLVVALLWMQPLNRLALRASRRATEEACDDWALSRTGEPRGLASSIGRVVQWAAGAGPDPVLVSMAGDAGSGTAGRVERILRGTTRRDPRWKRLGAALLVAAPLPLLPSVPAPPQLQTEVWVEGREVQVATRESGVGPESVTAHIVLARIRAD